MSSRFCWLNSGTTAQSLSSWRSQSARREHRALPVAVLLAVFVHPATYWQLIPPGLLFVAVYAASMWLFGMNRYERGLVTGPLRRILHRQ